jgi:hypothetical protein
MYTRERIKEVVEECLQYYTMGDNKTDKEEKENFVESVMMELDNSNTILIGKEKKRTDLAKWNEDKQIYE